MAETIASMKERGIDMIYGRWLIEGAPRVLLIDTGTGYRYLEEWKGDLWNTSGIPSPEGDHETNEAIVFGYLVAWFLGEVSLFSRAAREICLMKQTTKKNSIFLTRRIVL